MDMKICRHKFSLRVFGYYLNDLFKGYGATDHPCFYLTTAIFTLANFIDDTPGKNDPNTNYGAYS